MTEKLLLGLGALALLLLGAACAKGLAGTEEINWPGTKELVRSRFPEAPQLSVAALAERLASGEPAPLLIDVREPEEYAVSHLPGAINAQGDTLVEQVSAAGDRDVVLYCSVGYRSSQEAEKLLERGFSRVSNLEGSIFEWANAGHAVMRGSNEVEEVHPYDDEWGALLDRRLWSYGQP